MKNLKIRSKLFILVAFLLLCLIVLGALSIIFMNQINQRSMIISSKWVPYVTQAEELNTAFSDFRLKEYKHILTADPAEMATVESELSQLQAQIENSLAEFPATQEEDQKLLEQADIFWQRYLSLHNEIISLSRENDMKEAMNKMINDSFLIFQEETDQLLMLVSYGKSAGSQATEEAQALYTSALSLTWVILAGAFFLSLALSFLLIKSILKPVNELDEAAKKIASGKLDTEITYQSKDELGRLAVNFNQTVLRLKEYTEYINEISNVLNEIAQGNLNFELKCKYQGKFVILQESLLNIKRQLNDTLLNIRQAAQQVAAGSSQLADTAQMLSQGAEEQARSVTELSGSIGEISEQIKSNADHALLSSQKASKVSGDILESNRRMQEMNHAMEKISMNAKEVNKIIKTIEDIAFQTNLLALNAAVEAARAGSAGKGFAVVAEEVRSLASKSSEASKNTAILIENALHSVEEGSVIANETSSVLTKVVEGAQEINALLEKISSASEKQAEAVDHINNEMNQISEVVQNNSATAQESAATSEELSGQSALLKDATDRFQLKEENSDLTTEFMLQKTRQKYD